jgi:hypothetical protein
MSSSFRISLFLLATFAVALPAQVSRTSPDAPRAAAPPTASVPFPSADSLRQISVRGRRLWEYNYVLWYGEAAAEASDLLAHQVERFIARRVDSTQRWELAGGKLSAGRDTFFISHRVNQHPQRPGEMIPDTLPRVYADTGYYTRAARAQDLAYRSFQQLRAGPNPPANCPYSIAVLPVDDASGDWWVYVYPTAVQPGIYPLGSDVRYRIDASGRRIVAERRMHNAIIPFDGREAHDKKMVAGTHSAVLDNIPEDTDVFHVILREPEVPQYVVSDAFVYRIEVDGRIHLLGRSEELLRK